MMEHPTENQEDPDSKHYAQSGNLCILVGFLMHFIFSPSASVLFFTAYEPKASNCSSGGVPLTHFTHCQLLGTGAVSMQVFSNTHLNQTIPKL